MLSFSEDKPNKKDVVEYSNPTIENSIFATKRNSWRF